MTFPPGEEPVATSESTADSVLKRRRIRTLMTSIVALFFVTFVFVFVIESVFLKNRDSQPGHNSWSYESHGFRGLFEILVRLGYDLERFRESYYALPPAAESVLLVLDPVDNGLFGISTATKASDDRRIAKWVASGGCVIATRPGRDLPRVAGFDLTFDEVEESSPERRVSPSFAGLFADAPSTTRYSLTGMLATEPPLNSFSGEVDTLTLREASRLSAFMKSTKDLLIDVFARTGGTWASCVTLNGKPLAVTRQVGSGRIILVSTALPFANAALKNAAFAEVVASLIHFASDRGNRQLYMDERIHGYVERSGLWRWVRETPLFYPVATSLLIVILLGWYGGVSFGPPSVTSRTPRRAKEEFVLSLGDLYRRGAHYGHVIELIVQGYEHHLHQLFGRDARHLRNRPGEPASRFSYREPRNESELMIESRRIHDEYMAILTRLRKS